MLSEASRETHTQNLCVCVCLYFTGKQTPWVARTRPGDESVHMVKSHSYSVGPALTSVLYNSCGWQRCAPSLSAARGIKTALRSSSYTRMRWKIMIPLRKVNTSDVSDDNRQSRLLSGGGQAPSLWKKNKTCEAAKWIENELGTRQADSVMSN